MATSRHSKYYFLSGDIVIKVEDTLFKIHADILERHSGFFEDMFTTPLSDESEGMSDKNPLCLPEDLCSARAFAAICKFLYPSVLGVLPSVETKDLGYWEPVLDASLALQVPSIESYILEKLGCTRKASPSMTARLLGIATRLGYEDLKWECYFDLIYRTYPLGLGELEVLEKQTIELITTIRELVRDDLAWELNDEDVQASKACQRPAGCRDVIVQSIRERLRDFSGNNMGECVFDIENSGGLCQSCDRSCRLLAHSYRRNSLDETVRGWIADRGLDKNTT
ncbi:hypothetical protein BDV93DRAFT_563664 [Ceratobasidium sp. AG-I]|nr:hypothetical protein BDV93DRAFT_563664 [Ceratobasidium sp. AG-I]